MLSEVIEKISFEFQNEAKSSPNLMKDMASMEKYMAESYSDRTLIELLQNADDAFSKKALLYINDKFTIFANDGRIFNEKDVMSICRSGASNKIRGESIGHRGIGFKSTTSLTNDIIIYSNNTFFTFSKKHCAEILNVDLNDVPTIRIPFLIERVNINIDILKEIERMQYIGYSTFFIFVNAKKDILENEIKSFEKSCMIFLNNIEQLFFETEIKKEVIVKRTLDEGGENVTIIDNNISQKWWLPKISEKMIAFKLDDKDEVIECSNEEAVFHNFMPTVEKCPYKFKINADFSTDPSRKSIILDDNTKLQVNQVCSVLCEIIQKSVSNKFIHSDILKLFISRGSYNTLANLLFDNLNIMLKNNISVEINDGTFCKLEDYLLIDENFDLLERLQLRENSKIINEKTNKLNSAPFEIFINCYSNKRFDTLIYLQCLKDTDFMEKTEIKTIEKMYVYVIKKLYTIFIINKTDEELSGLLQKDHDGEVTSIDGHILDVLKNYLSIDEMKWFAKKIDIKMPKISNPVLKAEIRTIKRDFNLSKWKSAEQQVVDIENMNGNKAEYVGSKNLGYDVFSITQDGEERYIEVKLLSSDRGDFSLTNNEYASAHEYGNKFILCLVVQKESEIKLTYIKNPLESLSFEKRVRQWEWYCNEFDGEVKIYKYR